MYYFIICICEKVYIIKNKCKGLLNYSLLLCYECFQEDQRNDEEGVVATDDEPYLKNLLEIIEKRLARSCFT